MKYIIILLSLLTTAACFGEIDDGLSAAQNTSGPDGGCGGEKTPTGGEGGAIGDGGKGEDAMGGESPAVTYCPDGSDASCPDGSICVGDGVCVAPCDGVPDGETGQCHSGFACLEGECVPCDEHGFEDC